MKEQTNLKQNISFLLYLLAWGVIESVLVFSFLMMVFS
jgi:hypothetical protein